MNKAPFPNTYLVKKVADADSKCCVVCYKSSNMVMLAENKRDFFYLCPSHLKDINFAMAIESEEYIELKNQKSELEKKIVIIKKDMEANKPYNWTRLAQRVGLGSNKNNLDDVTDKQEGKDHKKKSDDKFKDLEKELVILNTSLKDTNDKIAAYKFSTYTLDKGIYQMRLQNQFKARLAQKREQEMHNPGFFPSAPTNSIGKQDS